MSILFFSQTGVGLIFTAIGGHFSDRWNKKQIVLVCTVLEILMLLGFYATASLASPMALAFVGVGTALTSAFSGSAMQVWFAHAAQTHEKSLERGVGRRNSYLMLAKVFGMSLGPIIYSQLKVEGLLVDCLFSVLMLGFLIFSSAPNDQVEQDTESFTWKQTFNLNLNSQIKAGLVLTALGASTSLPIINAGLYTLRESFRTTEIYFSAFWLVGALGSLLGNTLMSRGLGEKWSRQGLYASCVLICSIGLILMSISPTAEMMVGSFGIVTATNSIMTNLAFSRIFTLSTPSTKGRLVALNDIVADGSILILLSSFVAVNQQLPLPLGLGLMIPFVILRLPFARKTFI